MQKRHRTFIAINLPGDVKKVLAKYQDKWPELPAKWVPQENLHITLVFLGDLTEQELGEVCVIAKEVAARHDLIDININHVGYGPTDKIPPKMVWASGEKSEELALLKEELEDALLEKVVNFKPEIRGFIPHVNLARIKEMQWRYINPEERPEVSDNIESIFTVESIEVMESELKKDGPEYTIIESISLGN